MVNNIVAEKAAHPLHGILKWTYDAKATDDGFEYWIMAASIEPLVHNFKKWYAGEGVITIPKHGPGNFTLHAFDNSINLSNFMRILENYVLRVDKELRKHEKELIDVGTKPADQKNERYTRPFLLKIRATHKKKEVKVDNS
jgi:hypothetical protein